MEKNNINVLPEKVDHTRATSDTVTGRQGENSNPSGSTQKYPAKSGKTDSLNEAKESNSPTTIAQNELTNKKELEDISCDDADIFEDAIEDMTELKGKTKTEKYFSDIESSDDSRGYEITSATLNEVVDDKANAEVAENSVSSKDSMTSNKSKKTTTRIELELEPVESEEEYFEESPPLEELSTVPKLKENLPDKTKVNETEEVKMNSISLLDEEEDDSKEHVNEVGQAPKANVTEIVSESLILSQVSSEEELFEKEESVIPQVSSLPIQVAEGEVEDQGNETDKIALDSINKTLTDGEEDLITHNEPSVSSKKDEEEVNDESSTNLPVPSDDDLNELSKAPTEEEVDIDVPADEEADEENTAIEEKPIELTETVEVDKQAEEKIDNFKEAVLDLESPIVPDATEKVEKYVKSPEAVEEKEKEVDTTESENKKSLEETGDEKHQDDKKTSLNAAANLTEVKKPLETSEKDLNSIVDSTKSTVTPVESKEKVNNAIIGEKCLNNAEIPLEKVEESMMTTEKPLEDVVASEKSVENKNNSTEQKMPAPTLDKLNHESNEKSVDSISNEAEELTEISKRNEEEKREIKQAEEKSVDTALVTDISDNVLDPDAKTESVSKENEKSLPTEPVEVKADEPLKEMMEIDNDSSKTLDQIVNQKESEEQLSTTEKNTSGLTIPSEKVDEKKENVEERPEKPTEPESIRAASPEDVEMLEIIETIDNEETPSNETKSKFDASTKDDTTMKSADSGSDHGAASDDEEPLLVIDTSHKEDNENEDNDMDTETEQTATSAQTTDSSSDGSLEIFYDKECVNYECKHGSKNFFRATMFTLSYYKISKKRSKAQFVCEECYDRALDSYEEMCKTLKQKQPLLHGASIKAQEFVEIIDSSDEEESDSNAEKVKDENALPKESIELLEAELEGAIRKVMHNVEIQNQLSWTKQILQQRLNNLEEDAEFVSEQLRLLQKKADHMHNALYQCPKIKIRQLTPLDLNSGRSYSPEAETSVPPIGDVIRGSIRLNETYYAVKNKAIASWVPCKVIELIDGYVPHLKNLKHYKIKFLKSKYPMLKTVSAKHMAFFNPPKVRLPIGTRVIAYFDASSLSRGKEKMLIPSAFYPGIIAEPLKDTNRFRYLVFYDDGYFQYVYHKDVRLVCHSSENVWEDVHHQSRDFIHSYLTHYSVNRPMVQTQKGQNMLVDYNGKWIYSRVIDVDCSLVQMQFEGCNRSEWIYRGSTRLGPVYKESNDLVPKNPWSMSRVTRRSEPFIRYINGDDNASPQRPEPQQPQRKPAEVRSVAKKSVSRTDSSSNSHAVPTVRHLNNSTIFVDDDNKPKGKVVYYTARKNLPPRRYVPHICSPTCPFSVTHNLSLYCPLAKPLLSGWERQVFRQKSKKFIVYRGPCGKRMRNMEELHRYLRVTDNELNVDNFDFSSETNCLAEYVIESCIVQKKDISNGKERMPIPCVNYYDNTMPPDCIYSSRRIPTEGVPLNLDREFLVGCDCEDDCSDKTKCSCWELTYAGAKYGMPNVPNEMVGYQYKRLYEHVPTGIYECNSRCKCKANCINRVVQQPLQSKLQVFKTSNRGWGLRCINDVPRGSFICVYAGHLLTEQKANEGGLDAGDEYFAELDYIEVAEQIKEGYESDVVEPDEDEDMYNPDKDDDDDEFVGPGESRRNKAFNTRLRTRRSTKNSTDAEHDSQERQVISFEPNKRMGQPDHSSEKQTIRKLFGKDEACYIMDAKVTGNLGRYFNHSCSPNLFVQNVFVDTHDLRFPWVAFFAFTHIRAGTELTWNYNYEVGVVPGKVLYCQCGAPNCRQRLL